MTPTLRTIAIVAALSTSFIGCGKNNKPISTAKHDGAPVEVVEPPPTLGARPISNAEAEKFALELRTAVQKKDAAKVVSLMRVDRIVERVLVDVNPSEVSQRILRKTWKPEFGDGFAKKLISNLQPGVRFDLLKVRRAADRPVAVYRLLGEPGVNYYLLTLERAESGEIVVQDYTILMDGTPVGDTLRRTILETEADLGPGAKAKLKERDSNTLAELEQATAVMKLANTGKFAEALETYRNLPPMLRAERMTRVVAVHCARQVSEEEFAKEFMAFRDALPNDPSLLFLSISFHENRKEHAECLKAIDALDAVVGGDPHLDVLRSNAYQKQGKFAEAIAAAEKAARVGPTLGEAYWRLIDLHLEQKAFAKVASALRAVIEQGGEDFSLEQLQEAKEYAEFRKSPQFAEFEKWYAARKK